MKPSKQTPRDRRRSARRLQKARSSLFISLMLATAVLTLAFLAWKSIGQPPLGETFVVTGEGEHVPDGNPLPAFSTDPPTSGPHYNTPLPEGFYEEDSREAVALPNPHGFIVHSMEHGYVVFWYNCAILTAEDCATLKADIRSLMAEYNNFKIIAFPWKTTATAVVATSWGRMLEMAAWDAELAASFIERNRNQAPESEAR